MVSWKRVPVKNPYPPYVQPFISIMSLVSWYFQKLQNGKIGQKWLKAQNLVPVKTRSKLHVRNS